MVLQPLKPDAILMLPHCSIVATMVEKSLNIVQAKLMQHCTSGYTSLELDAAQKRYDLTFPPDLIALFLHSLHCDVASLIIVLAANEHRAVEVRFDPPRAFRSYSESDFHDYLKGFDGRLLVASAEEDCGIWMSDAAPYLQNYREHARWQGEEPEDVFSCLIRTPQECVEMICFEEPSFRAL